MNASAAERMESKNAKHKRTNERATAETENAVNFSDELNAPRWSVMTFDEVAVRELPYDEAVRWLEKLRGQNVHGLCIVTDEAANRFSSRQ